MIARPRRWDLSVVRHFMYVLGPLSSIFDFMTFGLLRLFGAGETLFHTAWFVESLATQVLVIFIIRAARPFRTPPHPLLIVSSLSAVGIALVLPYSPLAPWLGFAPMPASLVVALAGVVMVYLFAVHIAKNWVFTRHDLA